MHYDSQMPNSQNWSWRSASRVMTCHGDMRMMPIRSESNQIKHHKTKRSKMCEGPSQPILLGPPKCECDMKYNEI